VWVGADNLPLAAERAQKATAGFMMFHGDTATKKSWHFMRKDDHLVVARFEELGSFSGFGQKGDAHSVDVVTVH
jgi:hypothetical protein